LYGLVCILANETFDKSGFTSAGGTGNGNNEGGRVVDIIITLESVVLLLLLLLSSIYGVGLSTHNTLESERLQIPNVAILGQTLFCHLAFFLTVCLNTRLCLFMGTGSSVRHL
jgi:hypothetical protein